MQYFSRLLWYLRLHLQLIFWINWSLICDKRSSEIPRAQSGVFKMPLLSNKQSKTQRLFIYCHECQRNAEHPHIWEAARSKCLTFLLEKWLKLLINCQNHYSSRHHTSVYWIRNIQSTVETKVPDQRMLLISIHLWE